MATNKPRVNIVLNENLYKILSMIAKRDNRSLSEAARELITRSLEENEDIYWEFVAAERDKTFSSKKAVSHKDIWK